MGTSLMRALILFCIFLIGCEEASLRERSRPSEEGPEVTGFDLETIQSVKANKAAVISVANTTVTISENTLAEDTEVRLRRLKGKPEHDSVASLGEAKGDVIELVMYNKQTEEIYASSLLDKPIVVSQALSGVSDESKLKYVAITAEGTDNAVAQVLSRKAITTSTALVGLDLNVIINLNSTHVTFYAVESAAEAVSVTILDSGNDTSNVSGGKVTNGSSGASTSSGSTSSTSSSGGSDIDCTGLGHDPDNEAWIAVPANSVVGQNESFCVMKYEAKKKQISFDPDEFVAASEVAGLPWVSITQEEAMIACDLLNNGDPSRGYKLISNEMWQTIARNIETAQDTAGHYLNWSGGDITGGSRLNSGLADGTAGPCDAVIESVGNNCSTQKDNPLPTIKRTHTLANGGVIWDLSGNIMEWTSSSVESAESHGLDSYIAEKTWDGTQHPLENAATKLKWGPTYSYFNNPAADFEKPDSAGMGRGSLAGYEGGVIRGGTWDGNDSTGVFHVTLVVAPDSFEDNRTGFRCVATPGS